MDLNFKNLPVQDLAEELRKMYGTVLSIKGKEYSRPGLINLQAGLNRHLQDQPHKRSIDLMNDKEFLQANKVFTRCLRDNKEKGLNVSRPRQAIEQEDLEILFKNYFPQDLRQMIQKFCCIKFSLMLFTTQDVEERKACMHCLKHHST